jgi:hypothetical protein
MLYRFNHLRNQQNQKWIKRRRKFQQIKKIKRNLQIKLKRQKKKEKSQLRIANKLVLIRPNLKNKVSS